MQRDERKKSQKGSSKAIFPCYTLKSYDDNYGQVMLSNRKGSKVLWELNKK